MRIIITRTLFEFEFQLFASGAGLGARKAGRKEGMDKFDETPEAMFDVGIDLGAPVRCFCVIYTLCYARKRKSSGSCFRY